MERCRESCPCLLEVVIMMKSTQVSHTTHAQAHTTTHLHRRPPMSTRASNTYWHNHTKANIRKIHTSSSISVQAHANALISMHLAVDAMVEAGLVVSVAAGNDNSDACSTSPASADYALTVGSTTSSDLVSYFSNYGAIPTAPSCRSSRSSCLAQFALETFPRPT